jgi:threonine/homoserine/homoserine lactone efflux protein
MTHITREAAQNQAAQNQSAVRSNRAAFRDRAVNSFFNPYFFLCLVLVVGGAMLAAFDAKGIPLLILGAVLAAIIRLLHTIRSDLREANELRQAETKLLRHVLVSAQNDAATQLRAQGGAQG